MKKLFVLSVIYFLGILQVYGEEINFTVNVHGVTINGGMIYGLIYTNAGSFRIHQADFSFQGNPINESVSFALTLPAGEYVIEVYQDSNNNGSLDLGWFNIPKEPVGITNFNGRGIPNNFNRQKVTIHNGLIINIQLFKL